MMCISCQCDARIAISLSRDYIVYLNLFHTITLLFMYLNQEIRDDLESILNVMVSTYQIYLTLV